MPARYRDAYVPDARMPWNLLRVVHLRRRAAFAAPWDELQRDLKAGPQASIDRLLAGEEKEHVPAELNPDEYLNNDLKGQVHDAGLPDTSKTLRSRVQRFMHKLLVLPKHVINYFLHPKISYCASD